MNTLVVLNDPHHGTERVHNGIRLGQALHEKGAGARVTLFSWRTRSPSLLAGARRSTMDELAATAIEADKVPMF